MSIDTSTCQSVYSYEDRCEALPVNKDFNVGEKQHALLSQLFCFIMKATCLTWEKPQKD